METIEIPGDFYIYKEINGYTYLCHRSCVLINGKLSNRKYINLYDRLVSNKSIAILRHICGITDEIEEKTYFVNGKFNNLFCYVQNSARICLIVIHFCACTYFDNVNDLLEYLDKKHPECIKNTDIKIALKD
jgi:hypothetical protein